MDELKILSMNCRGLGDQKKRRDVMHYLRSLNVDIVFLQDTHLTARALPYFNSLWKGGCYHACYSSCSRGSSILVSKNTEHNIIKEISSVCGNYVIAICRIGTEVFAFINIYGPNRDQPNFFVECFAHLENIEIDHVILGGDMNFVIDYELDSLNYVRENNVNAKRKFLEISDKHNLLDIWRSLNPSVRKYTWSRKNPFKCGRLDMFFVSEHLKNRVTNVDILPGYKTDHNAISLTIQTKQNPRGNGLWMFNVSHLQNEAYVDQVKLCIRDTIKQYAVPIYSEDVYTNPDYYSSVQLTISECLFYETLIMMIRGESIKFAKQQAKRLKAKEEELKRAVDKAQEKFSSTNLESDLDILNIAKSNLEESRRPMIEGLIVRSRVQWHEQGERNSKYFLSLEKRNGHSKSIQYIKDGDRIMSKTGTILDNFSKHMKAKYSDQNKTEVDEDFVARNINTSLTANDRLRLDSDLTLNELTEALNKMKKGKTPGSNGFPVEFFRTFWKELGPFLHRAFIATLELDQELRSHREGIIKLIPKQGKSPYEFKGWRPITLMNVDYKIVSTAISNRLKSVISEIISPCQTAYISGRYIGENTRLLFDLLTLAKNRNMKGMVVAADFEAAFESVSWEYLKLVMKRMDFGSNFLKMIELLYLNPRNYSRIMLNGHIGTEIFLQRGIRQGDPSSGYLFDIAVEALAGQINNSTKLRGLDISTCKQIRISQYADDTILLLDGSIESLRGAANELVQFARVSGLKANLEKTSCLPIGILTRNQLPDNLDIKVVDELKVLGTTFSTDVDQVAEKNIQSKITSIRREIAQWKRRHITPIGKICVIKTLLMSKLVHFFIALPNPSAKLIKEIENMLFGFLWSNKGDKIKRTKLVQKYESDGLKMISVKAFLESMKLSWLKRLMVSKADWTSIAHIQLPEVTKLLTYGKEKLVLIRNRISNPFYKDLVNALIRFVKDYKPSNEELVTETIWFSDHAGFPKSIIKEWDRRGLRFICDLYNPLNGILYSLEDIKRIYKIRMTFLCYERLTHGLRQCLTSSEGRKANFPNIPFRILAVTSKEKFTKFAYDIYVKAMAQEHLESDERKKNKWENEIGGYITGTSIQLINATKSCYLFYLHYRIASRIYPTNKLLFAMNITSSNVCSFCQEATETLSHLFWECPKVQIFIQEVLTHIKRKYNKQIDVNVYSWFFLKEMSNIDSLVITIMKYVIHKSRINGSTPSLSMMANALKLEAEKEYHGAKLEKHVDKFENKWGELTRILS